MLRVLYIEHGIETTGMRQAMEKGHASVDLLPFGAPTEIPDAVRKVLKDSHYDLVVTDAYFLPAGQEHLSDETDGEYLLDKIVAEVRAIENQRVKIAVLTHFSSRLLSESKQVLERVDYLWDKWASTQTFVTWQTERIRAETQKVFPEHALVDHLETILTAGDPARGLPWRDSMSGMLQKYRQRSGEMEQIRAAELHLRNIAQEMGIGEQFSKLLDATVDAETFNIAARPSAWGHLRHVLNVFWLGYCVLNTGLVDTGATARSVFGDGQDAEGDEAAHRLNEAWFLASLFHDVGLLGERMGDLTDRFNRLLSIYPLIDHTFAGPRDQLSSKLEELLDETPGAFGADPSAWLRRAARHARPRIDHGVLSALTILDTFKDRAAQPTEAAALAVALHDLATPRCSPAESLLPQLKFSQYPLPCLLIICDQLEVWDRQTGQENLFSALPLECAELSRLEFREAERRLEGEINYLPFRYISPGDAETETILNSLQTILQRQVMPALNKVSLGDPPTPNLSFTFHYDGRERLGEWPS